MTGVPRGGTIFWLGLGWEYRTVLVDGKDEEQDMIVSHSVVSNYNVEIPRILCSVDSLDMQSYSSVNVG